MSKISKINQKFAIQKDLFYGFGVEDIAIRNLIQIDDVRKEVDRLRKTGQLKAVLGVQPHE